MGEYITGTTNQGGTIGSSTLPIKDFRVDTLTANTINYTTLNPSVNVSIDDVTIIKNSDGELEVNPDLSVTLMNLPNLVYGYTSPTTAGIQFAASGDYNPFINFDTSSNEINIMMSSSATAIRTLTSYMALTIDNSFTNYIEITQGTTSSGDSISFGTTNYNFYFSNSSSQISLTSSTSKSFTLLFPQTSVIEFRDTYIYQSTRNRIYQQNLTASTTTSTTMVALGSPNSITPKFSGHIIITAELRISNNTLSDGVSVELLNGSTVLDTETYTQEGLASNEHSLVFHYELTNQTVGTALSISLNYAAVTGGTASAKIVSFICEEI